jgi:hypothetical protein
MGQDGLRCPSAPCAPGAVLLGIVLPGGRIAYAAGEVVIDEEFVAIAREGRSPEMRFRFSSPCVRAACKQWTGAGCGVIDGVLDYVGVLPDDTALPRCVIRPSCRWFAQRGAQACAVCPRVVTDCAPSVDIEGRHCMGTPQ